MKEKSLQTKKARKSIGLKHYHYLIDDFGIWQHTKGRRINRSMGYSLDDAARGLVVAALLGLEEEALVLLGYIERTICFDSNFFTNDRKPINFPMSDDAMGQAYWAASLCLDKNIHPQISSEIIKRLSAKLVRIKNIRGKIYTVLGSVLINNDLTKDLTKLLKNEFQKESGFDWPWIEHELSYGNAIIPLGFLEIAKKLKDDEVRNMGLKMLDFLNSQTKYHGVPIAIGNKRWYRRDKRRSLYDQQPIDPAYQVMANAEAYEQTKLDKYKTETDEYFSWFWGNNVAKKPLIQADDESCLDGIMRNGLSQNRGSENIVCYLIAQEYLQKLLL